MNYALFYPLIYLFLGFFLAKVGIEKRFHIRWYAAAFLTLVCIPIVIAYTVAYHEHGVFSVMIAIFIIMAIMLVLALNTIKDPMMSLCFCFLNMGWLGLPIVLSLYGERAATVMIAGCVASSIFGNSSAAGILVKDKPLLFRFSKTFRSRPFLALIAGLILFLIGKNFQPYLEYPYHAAKLIMSVLGMLVLGIWIADSKMTREDFFTAFKLSLFRIIVFSILISGLVLYGYYYKIHLITDNLVTLYLMGLLPPAANIVVLETYYLRSGRSAPLIATSTVLSLIFIAIYASIVHFAIGV